MGILVCIHLLENEKEEEKKTLTQNTKVDVLFFRVVI